MSDGGRDLTAFARTVEALEPYLADLVFVGGWAHFLYTLRAEASPLAFTPLTTQDADVAAPLRLAPREETIAQRLVGAGFERRLSGDHMPSVSEYALGDEETGFYIEFLAPLEGGEVKRGGRVDATTSVGGVSAQKPRHLELPPTAPWRVSISREAGTLPVPLSQTPHKPFVVSLATFLQAEPLQCRTVPEAPAAQTSLDELPHTPSSEFVVPLGTLDHVLPFQWRISPHWPTAQTSVELPPPYPEERARGAARNARPRAAVPVVHGSADDPDVVRPA